MGLETVHPEILPKLNKRMTLEQFPAAAGFLRANEIDLRVFILVQPPFMQPEEAVHWAQRSVISLRLRRHCGDAHSTRGGNGAMEASLQTGSFHRLDWEHLEIPSAMAWA